MNLERVALAVPTLMLAVGFIAGGYQMCTKPLKLRGESAPELHPERGLALMLLGVPLLVLAMATAFSNWRPH